MKKRKAVGSDKIATEMTTALDEVEKGDRWPISCMD